jgi:chromosome segregation ATPase
MSGNPLSLIYTKELPPLEDVQRYDLPELQAFVAQVEDDVGLINEENRVFGAYLHAQRKDRDGMPRDGDDDGVGLDGPSGNQAPAAAGGGKRRGHKYRRKSSEERSLILGVDDKATIATQEGERLKQDRDRQERVAEDAREQFRATLEEALNRAKEVKMEMAHFRREVSSDKGVSADKVLKYMQERPEELARHLGKTREKSEQMQKQISKHLTNLRQREDVGEAFHEIDFSQLEIENHQFLERIEQKNEELVELKGTTTRTVQTLNALTDKLGSLTADQGQLRKELKLRQEHVDKLTTEIEQVKKEGAAAQKKNTNLKIQHESVKVPKVEDYIAQKAEVYELQKAVQNWKRKVEIASGHVAVMKQQMLSLRKKLGISTSMTM